MSDDDGNELESSQLLKTEDEEEKKEQSVEFDADIIIAIVDNLKKVNRYDQKDVAAKLHFKAAMEIQIIESVMRVIRYSFSDLPDYDPMYQGQHIKLMMERLFPDVCEEMQFRWNEKFNIDEF